MLQIIVNISPEGTLSQVEYALEDVKKGGFSIGMIGDKCIIILQLIENSIKVTRSKGQLEK